MKVGRAPLRALARALLGAVVLAGALVPCVPARPIAAHAAGAPCHLAAPTLQAPCPCGCGERGAPRPSARLGLAVLLEEVRIPRPGREPCPLLALAPISEQPAQSIDKVPRAA